VIFGDCVSLILESAWQSMDATPVNPAQPVAVVGGCEHPAMPKTQSATDPIQALRVRTGFVPSAVEADKGWDKFRFNLNSLFCKRLDGLDRYTSTPRCCRRS
jgi:hypothetical protein